MSDDAAVAAAPAATTVDDGQPRLSSASAVPLVAASSSSSDYASLSGSVLSISRHCAAAAPPEKGQPFGSHLPSPLGAVVRHLTTGEGSSAVPLYKTIAQDNADVFFDVQLLSVKAKGLTPQDKNGLSDPYFMLTFMLSSHPLYKSPFQKETLDPEWNFVAPTGDKSPRPNSPNGFTIRFAPFFQKSKKGDPRVMCGQLNIILMDKDRFSSDDWEGAVILEPLVLLALRTASGSDTVTIEFGELAGPHFKGYNAKPFGGSLVTQWKVGAPWIGKERDSPGTDKTLPWDAKRPDHATDLVSGAGADD